MLVKREGAKNLEIFVSLARAYEERCYIHYNGASLIPYNPVQQLRGDIHVPLFFSWHHTAHHSPQIPGKALIQTWGAGSPVPVPGANPWPFCITKTNQDFSQHSALPVCNHGLQLSVLTRPWGGFVSNSPQWGPLILQVTSTCPSDFTFSSSCIIHLSVPEPHRLSTVAGGTAESTTDTG